MSTVTYVRLPVRVSGVDSSVAMWERILELLTNLPGDARETAGDPVGPNESRAQRAASSCSATFRM